jgi:hypothetical protein
MHWFFKCPHCGEWITLILEYPESIIPLPKGWLDKYPNIFKEGDTHAYICTHCKMPIDSESRMKGIWAPLYKDNTRVRGYQLTQLVAPWISATNVMQKRDDYKLDQLFTNYVIGLPYLGDNILLTDNDVDSCVDTSMKDPSRLKVRDVVIGGDWGNESWQVALMPNPERPEVWIIMDLFKITDGEKTDSAEKNPHIKFSVDFFRKWRAVKGVYDAGYGKDRNFQLLQEFPGRIYSCFYPNNETDYTKDFNDRWEENGQKVSVDRTMTLKLMVKKFKDREIIIPGWIYQSPLYPVFKKHLTNLVSIKDIDEDKDGVEKIVERIGCLPGGDHFGHALNYAMICARKLTLNKTDSDFFM